MLSSSYRDLYLFPWSLPPQDKAFLFDNRFDIGTCLDLVLLQDLGLACHSSTIQAHDAGAVVPAS